MLSETQTDLGNSNDRWGYQPPVSKLIPLGESSLRTPQPFNYRAMGITEDHLAELARMSLDRTFEPTFDYDECDECDEIWAPIHAMRAMLQLGTESTIEPLVRLLECDNTSDSDEIDDWFTEEIPEALARFGATAVPRISRLLADESMHTHSRLAAARTLEKIASENPELRAECVSAIAAQLERFEQTNPQLNGGLVGILMDLNAVESAPVIERAFAANMVDESMAGDWDDVQIHLGLRPPLTAEEYREKLRKRSIGHWHRLSEPIDDDDERDDWDDSGDDLWETGDDDPYSYAGEPPEEQDDRPKMFMPEDIYTADERRKLAKQRHKERKAAEKARTRQKQTKNRR